MTVLDVSTVRSLTQARLADPKVFRDLRDRRVALPVHGHDVITEVPRGLGTVNIFQRNPSAPQIRCHILMAPWVLGANDSGLSRFIRLGQLLGIAEGVDGD